MQTKYVIYTITNLVNGKKYVGQSKDYISRWDSHKRSFVSFSKGKKCANSYLARSVAKYGLDNFKFEVIFCCYGLTTADYMETWFIDDLKTFAPKGYNLTSGGGGTRGCTVSEATKNRYKILFSGEGNPYFGKKHSDATKEILSKSRSNRVVIDGVEYKSVLFASEILNIGRSHIYKLVRIGKAVLLDGESKSDYVKPKSRNLRDDAGIKTYADYVYEFLMSVGGVTYTTEIRKNLPQFHSESLAKGLRNLRSKGKVLTERAKITGLPSATLKVVINPKPHEASLKLASKLEK